MESHLEFNELAFDKPENQAGLAGAHIPEKNLAIQPNRASKRVSASQSSKSPYKTRNPKGENAIFKRSRRNPSTLSQ